MSLTSAPIGVFAGLTEREARARLDAEGYNELPRHDRRTSLRIVLEVLREPMLALLLGAGFVYLLLGDLKEALILLAFGAMSIVITVIQETRTERVLEALRDLTSPRALVIRDGERRRVAGREVARGDLIVVAEGDRVPADASLREAQDPQTDESLLTGETVPVRKTGRRRRSGSSSPRWGGLALRLFELAGHARPRARRGDRDRATKRDRKIGQSLQNLNSEPPRLQRQTVSLVRLCALGGAAVSISAVVLYGTLRGGLFVLAGRHRYRHVDVRPGKDIVGKLDFQTRN